MCLKFLDGVAKRELNSILKMLIEPISFWLLACQHHKKLVESGICGYPPGHYLKKERYTTTKSTSELMQKM